MSLDRDIVPRPNQDPDARIQTAIVFTRSLYQSERDYLRLTFETGAAIEDIATLLGGRVAYFRCR